jgi:hypothetical protein
MHESVTRSAPPPPMLGKQIAIRFTGELARFSLIT